VKRVDDKSPVKQRPGRPRCIRTDSGREQIGDAPPFGGRRALGTLRQFGHYNPGVALPMSKLAQRPLSPDIAAAPALAGVADSPLPVLLAGKSTLHLYSVPGVVNNGAFATVFACTSTDTAPMRVGVEVFGDFGGVPQNDAVATSVSLDPGATVNFKTAGFFWLGGTTSPLTPGPIETGSARILATSKKLVCTALVADPAYPPATSWQLTIVKKKTQKGD
jgi:hypothetical protein